ncbi:DMT family transporter [Calidifontibacillus oryziterrae]|uniref:DMT family transporter n=1 Tax=Calidifontibacillus oryziterrae TaxID=1191699 RepID=UPI0002FB41C0|nr:DMT family transporter [Calidifontibacillus oryziterrae]
MNWKSPYFLLVIATMFWGGNFVIGKGFANIVPPFTLAFLRWFFAFLFLFPFAKRELINYKHLWKKEWKTLFWMALTGVAGFNTLVYIAVHYTTSINASLVNAPTPVLIMLLSFLFLKEKMQIRHFIGIIFSVIGVSWIVSRGSLEALLSFTINKGELLMLLAVTMWSVYSVIVKKNAHKFPASGVFLVTILIGIIILTPFTIYEWAVAKPMTFTFKGFIGFLYLGACASVISFICWNKAVTEIGPGKASPFLNLIPVFASIFAIIFLGETLTSAQLIGGVITITGVLITTGVLFKKTAKMQHSLKS